MMLKKTALLVCTFLCVFFLQSQSFGQSTIFPSGSAIIDMGSATPTVKNSLKPYGLIYALLKNNHVPISSVINSAKVKDGVDFVYNGKSYKGGTYVVSADNISTEVSAVLANWANQGVVIDYTTTAVTLNVTYKVNFVPKWVMDKTNGNIAVQFLSAAGIPSSAYSFKDPSNLGACEDLFVLPHADPTWATHSNLLDWNRTMKGAIWAGCHAVSVLENLVDPFDATRQMNFLTKGAGIGQTGGLLPFTDHNFTVTPFSHLLPGDPVAQYINKTDDAQQNGSETVYLPKLGSIWNPGAKIITSSPGQPDVPGLSPGVAAENVYGRAFDDPARGLVAYQASHSIAGTSADQIAAQRVFFNFSLYALNDKVPPIINASLNGQTLLTSAVGSTFSVSNTGTGTIASVQWTVSPASAGTFLTPNATTTTFTPSVVVGSTPVIITCTITESCDRISFDSKKFTVIPTPPSPNLSVVDYLNLSIADGCSSAGLTFNIFDNNADANSGTRTLLNVTGLNGATVSFTSNGNVTVTPAADFKGTLTGNYQITNGLITSNAAFGAISITVGDATKAPVISNDVANVIVDNKSADIDVLANDLVSVSGTVTGVLTIRDIVQKPSHGYVYINANGTLSYLSNKDETGGSYGFKYQACNTAGYCAIGTVTVTLSADGCPVNQYQNTTLSSTGTVNLEPAADAYIQLDAPSSNFNGTNILLNEISPPGIRRPLLRFDLSGITTTSVVKAANLTITAAATFINDQGSPATPFPAIIYQLSEPFNEAEVTWTNAKTTPATTAWSTPGGGARTGGVNALGTTLNDGDVVPANTTIGSKSLQVMVQSWVTTPAGNNGMIIIGDATQSDPFSPFTFYSRSEATASFRPKLNVTYTSPPPCLLISTTTYEPIAYPDAATTASNAGVTIDVKANDLNYYGNGNTVSAVATPAHGTAAINGSNQIVFTPTGTFVGVEEFTYTLKDQTTNATSTGKIRVTVTRVGPTIVSDLPASMNSNVSAITPTTTTVDVGLNDQDLQTGAGVIGAPIIVTAPANGVAEVLTGNLIKYTPSIGFVGTDVFTYRRVEAAVDACAVALSGMATVTIVVDNRPPVANPGVINTFACVDGVVKILDIASDPEQGTLSATIAGSPAHGTVVVTGDGRLVYTPTGGAPAYSGPDAFTYTVTDKLGVTSAAATVSITVSGAPNANVAPVAVNDSDTTLRNQLLYTNVIRNDSDPNGDVFSVNITAPGLLAATNGSIAVMPNKLVRYTPAAGFVGTDSYQYQITDSHPGCSASAPMTSVATVTITVKAIPTTLSGTVIADLNNSAAGTFTNISTTGEKGTNGNGSVYVYATDNTNKIIDRTPVDVDGTYLLSNIPSLTNGLTLVLSADDLATGTSLTTGSVPSGYNNSTPMTRALPITTLADMGPYDWGIYVNPILAGGTIIAQANVCSAAATPGTLTSTANATGGSLTATGYVYQWQSSVNADPTIGFSDIAGANATNYTPAGPIATTTHYRRRVTTNMDGAKYSNTVTVTYTASPVVLITPAIATISTGGNIGLSATGADSYTWSPATGLTGAATAAVTASPLSTTHYIVTGTLTPSGCSATAGITVTVINAGTVGANQNGCGPFTPATFTSVADAAGAVGITYQWQSSITSAGTGFANIGGATATAYVPAGAVTTTTYFKRIATGGGQSYSSNVLTATVNARPTISIAPTAATIAAGLTQTLTASGADTYAWTPAATLSAATGTTVIAAPAAGTTYNVTGTVTATGCNNTAAVLITVIGPGVIAGNQANCGSFTPTAFTSTADASGGGITYQWQSSATSATSGFANIVGATASTFAPSFSTVTTYYKRIANSGGQPYSSNVITVSVNAIPVVTIAPTGATITAGLSQTFTASGADTYSWTPATYLSSTNTASVIATPTATGNTVYTVTGTITASGCVSSATVPLTARPAGSLIPGTIGSPQTICSVTAPAAFTSTGATGGLGTIDYQWQQSLDNITFTNIPAATSVNYGAGALTQTTYFRRAASTSSDPAVFTASVKVNVLQKPVIAGGINGVCAMPRDTVKTFSVTPAALATRYVWTVPSTGGWSGASTTNTIDVKAGNTNGTITVTPFNLGCAGTTVSYNIAIIDYASVTITGTPVTAAGTNNNPIIVKIQLIDVLGNLIGCSGGPATMCSSGGTFTKVTDNGDGTYTSLLISSADNVTVCGSVAGVQISKTTTVTFTGPQGGIKSNGPIFDFEIPKITFTATDGRAPFTVIYHSDKAAAGKNDTLRNATSGTAYAVALIPATTLYKLVSVIDANGERRDRNFTRDTTTTRVVTSKVVITLKADPAKKEADSTWATRIVVHTQNIGDLDLANSQARLNLKDVFPNPVTYVLDSVKVAGATVVQNGNYDGVNNTDLFAKLTRKKTYNASAEDTNGMAPDGTMRDELWNNDDDETVVRVGDDGHSIYMFGPQSNLPVGMDATIILWLHVRPNGYTEPFVMQAVALGTGHTQDATSLTTSLSNDNDNVAEHPEVTKKGDPLPAVINLFPTASVGISLNAGTPVLQGDGTYNVLLSYKMKNYGNVNLKNVTLSQNLLTSIGAPSAFTVVGGITATGGSIINPAFDGKADTSMLAINNILGYKQESAFAYTINIAPNQLESIYRLQARASGYSDDLLDTVRDLSTDGTNPDPDDNNIPSEKIITTIVINLAVPPLVPGKIGIKTGSTTVLANGYCGSANNVEIIPTSVNTGGIDAYLYQWQSSTDNVTFKDIIGAEAATYTTASVTSSYFLRRGTISGSQIKFSNSVMIQIYPVPATPVIAGTGTVVVGKGNINLTSPLATAYLWSTGATTRSIVATAAGNYTVTVSDANGCTAIGTAYAITALDPGKVADVQKILTSAPALQQDGSFLLSFNIVATNLRAELLDTVRIADDLSKVFPIQSTFSVVDIKASGGLIANPSYNGRTNTNMLSDVSKLPGSKKDSVQMTIKVFPNGFSGILNNVAVLSAYSPLGFMTVSSNDPLSNSDPSVRLPTKFVIPVVDILIPTGFSPNQDGYNDKFVITRPFNTTIRMEIFNRWSNLVYKSLDYKNEWDGKGNQANRILGEDLPDGTYYYEILATNQATGVVRKFAGYITLKR
jgi:gliding motility-associated-like protein